MYVIFKGNFYGSLVFEFQSNSMGKYNHCSGHTTERNGTKLSIAGYSSKYNS